jgi:hypothetical protein
MLLAGDILTRIVVGGTAERPSQAGAGTPFRRLLAFRRDVACLTTTSMLSEPP